MTQLVFALQLELPLRPEQNHSYRFTLKHLPISLHFFRITSVTVILTARNVPNLCLKHRRGEYNKTSLEQMERLSLTLTTIRQLEQKGQKAEGVILRLRRYQFLAFSSLSISRRLFSPLHYIGSTRSLVYCSRLQDCLLDSIQLQRG